MFHKTKPTYLQGLLLALIIGIIIRLIPELLSNPYPIGWDTIYYAYRIQNGTLFGFWDNIFSTWLPTGMLILLKNITPLEPFTIVKIIAPLLYGTASAGIYFAATQKLQWSIKKSLFASLFFSLSIASLAISWQFYRNIFGIATLLFAIPLIRNNTTWKTTAALSLLSTLTALGHELTTLSLFFITSGFLLLCICKKEKIPYKLLIGITPAIFLFFGNIFLVSPYAIHYPNNLIWLDDSTWAHPANLFFLTNYLYVNTPIESYSSYFDLFYQVTSLFIILYGISLPLIATGYFKDRVLNLWILLLLTGSFGCLIIPFAAPLLWARWMLMLTIPFTFFATHGFWKAKKKIKTTNNSKHLHRLKVTKKIAYILFILFLILGGLFMTWPLMDGKYGLINWPGSFKYFPSTMQTSSVPLQDTQGVIESYTWLNKNMNNNTSLLVHDTFEFWTMLYLDKNHIAYLFDSNLEAASNLSREEGFDSAYFVWWNENIGWYNLQISKNWTSVYKYGRISVYKIY